MLLFSAVTTYMEAMESESVYDCWMVSWDCSKPVHLRGIILQLRFCQWSFFPVPTSLNVSTPYSLIMNKHVDDSYLIFTVFPYQIMGGKTVSYLFA